MGLPQEKITQQAQPIPRPELTREYVVGTGSWSALIGRVLSNFNDELEWMIGYDVYERMARDPTVSKNLQFQKLSVTSEGVDLHPAVSQPKKDKNGALDPQKVQEFALANEIKDFHQRSLDGLHRPLPEIIGEMMVALKRAHSVGEITYKEPVSTGPDAYKLLLKSIKVKPRNSTAFVIDAFRNVLGLTAWMWGSMGIVPSAQMVNGQQLIPLEKFAILAFDTEDEDPRGINPLRAAYNFWQAKCLVPGLHLKWLEKSAIPSTVGTTAEGAGYEQGRNSDDEPTTDPFGNALVKSAQEVLADSLSTLESGSSIAVPYGSTVAKIEVAGTGAQFTRCYLDFDTQIDYALSLQSGATKDSKSGSYASKRIFKDVLDILIWARKQSVAAVIQGVLNKGTEYNFGIENVHLTPIVMIGDRSQKDWSRDGSSLHELGSDLTDSQFTAMCQQIGVPSPEEGEVLPTRTRNTSGAQSPINGGQQ